MEYSHFTEKNWQTTVHVTLNAEDVNANTDAAARKLQKEVSIEGFRKGKVPLGLVKKLYHDNIETEAKQLAMERAWRGIIKECDFHIINEPEISDFQLSEDGGATFTVTFEVYPEITVNGYEGMRVEKIVYEVTDQDVENAIEGARQRNAMFYTIDEEAKEGDFIVADLQEVENTGVPVVGQKIENQQIWLNADDQELTPQLVGVKADEERRLRLVVNTQESEFIDQPGESGEIEKHYMVKVREVKERRLPDLDDEFAKDLGPYNTLDELYETVRDNLNYQAEHETENSFHNALADELIKKTDIEIPSSLLELYLDRIVDDVKKRNKDNDEPVDEELLRENYRPLAIHEYKWHLVSEKLISQLNLEATKEDIEQKLDHFREHGEDGIKHAEKVEKDKKELERLKDQIVYDKLYAFLAEHADVIAITKSWRELQETEEDEDL